MTHTPPPPIIRQYQHDYRAVAQRFGARAPGRNIIRYGLSNGQRASTTSVLRSIGVLERMLHPSPVTRLAPAASSTPAPPAPAAPAPSSNTPTGGLADVPGVPAAFAACVAYRESTDGQDSPDIYGIIPASGYNVAGMSVAEQKQVFAELYAQDGAAPWSEYDGC